MQNIQSKDFFKETNYNQETKEQIWMSQLSDSHDNICSCHTPFAHLLASIFPPGHRDRNSTIQQILERDYKELCLSGGNAETSFGFTENLIFKKEEENGKDQDIADEDLLEGLLTAAENLAEEGARR